MTRTAIWAITLMDQGNGKGSAGWNNEHSSGSAALRLFRRSGSEGGAREGAVQQDLRVLLAKSSKPVPVKSVCRRP